MTNLKRCVDLLKENKKDVYTDVCRVLSTLCNNIIKHPTNPKYRKVRLSNLIVSRKILPAAGAMECLFEIGFEEHDDHLLLPENAPLPKLHELRQLLLESEYKPTEAKVVNRLPQAGLTAGAQSEPATVLNSKSRNFFEQIKGHFHDVLRYEDPKLQQRAKSLVPLIRLQIGAMEKMRSLQRIIKTNGDEKSLEDLAIEDLILAELLCWFKEEFFQWVDSPMCTACSGTCTFQRVVISSTSGISRVEIYRCNSCGANTEFPRYSDPGLLLTSRRGRCGEWANTFALVCRSLGYDVRLVWDYTDHVWTEVWSIAGERWVHADPCENVMDRPLMYEKGWGKKLSYILAFSKDEIQDVTWRYTLDQPTVLGRRNLCTEQSLLSLVMTLNEQRQQSSFCSPQRKRFIVKRSLMELAELLLPPPGAKRRVYDDQDQYQGRISGSIAWRLARGETKVEEHQPRLWRIPTDQNCIELRYTASKDSYQLSGSCGDILEERSGWQTGVYALEGGIFRKVEQDWKMVYLARSASAQSGEIRWTLETNDSNVELDKIYFRATSAVYHGATVHWKIEGYYADGRTKTIPIHDSKDFHTEQLKGAFKLSLIASLNGGENDLAWQHAQLFRQSLDATEHSMVIRINLVENT